MCLAKNLKNKVFAKFLKLYDFKTKKNISRKNLSKSNDSPYLASPWPEDCTSISINDPEKQSLVIDFNSSLFFNYMKLSLIYPATQVTIDNYTQVKTNAFIHSSMSCEVLEQKPINKQYGFNEEISVTLSIKCKINYDQVSRIKLNVTNDNKTDQIKLTFNFGRKKLKNFKVGLCGIELYEYQTNDCGKPDRPRHSKMSSNTEEGYTQFTCDKGYEIAPKTTSGYLMACDINGEWDREFPICVPKSFCPLLNAWKGSPKITYINANFDMNDGKNVTAVNTIANHSCKNVFIDGYETDLSPETNSLRTCMDGKWSGSELKCVPNNFWRKLLGPNLVYFALFVITILISLIIILTSIIMCKSKRVVEKGEPQRGDSVNNHNYYESVRMSNVSVDHNYDYVYQGIDQTEQSFNNNSIYELTEEVPEMDTTDDKPDIVWSNNNTYG